MKKGFKLCPSCENEITEESMECEYCGEIQEHPKCKFYGEIEYLGQYVYCPICGYVGYADKGHKYNFFVRFLFLIAWMMRCNALGFIMYLLWKDEKDCICKCPKCGNTKIGTNKNRENGSSWRKIYLFTGLILWISGLLYVFLFKG